MKKTNFIVTFWLLLALISFVVFLVHFSELWYGISYLIVSDESHTYEDSLRSVIQCVPMIVITALGFYIGLKQGVANYKHS